MRCHIFALIALFACASLDAQAAEHYEVAYSAVFSAEKPVARATINLNQTKLLVSKLDFNAPSSQYTVVSHDGKLSRSNGRIIWQPPAKGGSLSYDYQIDSRRGETFDARHQPDWVLMRLDDLFPPAHVSTLKGATSKANITLQGPTHWSFESRYGNLTNTTKELTETERNFERPTGWMVGGKIGTRRDLIEGRNVAVSAPLDSGIRRVDTLAFLNWTLPDLTSIFPQLPDSILIVGAPEDMWRGGLSAPQSLYLHTDRPLISENGTSTLLHELIHLAGFHSAEDGADWIVEGFAEYYSLLILKRSGGISAKRFDQALAGLATWVAKDKGKLNDPSKGADTAAAVLMLHDLATELLEGGSDIDNLVTQLANTQPISQQSLVRLATDLLGHPSRVLANIKIKN
ncbi:MAG: hypothetical protein ACI9DH_001048 [Halioglobus sp.]|jgi:hypothetical protein